MTETGNYFSGWDIGGAHLKVSRCDQHGKLVNTLELPCPLWQGIDGLAETLQQALTLLDNHQDLHFLTLTGESADCFNDRQQGVVNILNQVSEYLPAENCRIFSQSQQWLSLANAQRNWQQVASMNWLATAYWLATHQSDALLIDIGSTTSDLICIRGGRPQLQAFDDEGRLRTGELRYTGVIRTPLMALAQQITFAGQQQAVANELFATTADIWRLLGQLPVDIADHSADGESWQLSRCRQRLARMVGSDANKHPDDLWQQLAAWYAEQQVEQLIDSGERVIKMHELPCEAPIIGAGIGRFLARQLAERFNRSYLDIDAVGLGNKAAVAAPASALALLGWQQFA